MNDFFNEIHQIDNDLDENEYKKRSYFSQVKHNVIEVTINKSKITEGLSRVCDIMSITHIAFEVNPHVLTENDKFSIIVGGNVVYNTSFNLLMMINKIEKKNEQYLLPLNDIYFFFCSTDFHESRIFLSIDNTLVKKINLFTTEYLLANDKLQQFKMKSHEKYVCCPRSISKMVNSANVNYISDFCGFIDGYYLETNIANIKSITINNLNNNENLINYDVDMIKKYCKIINNKLLYIPLDINKINLTDKSENNVKYFVNKAVRQLFIVKVVFFDIEKKFTLHTLNYNIMRWMSGMCGLTFRVYDYNNELNQVYKNMKFGNEILEGITIYSQNLSGKYNNLPDSIIELIVYDLKEDLTNLPVFLEKIEHIYYKTIDKNIKIKCPFGCEYIERKIEY